MQTCFKHTDVSNDAFAFLILENNALRYIDMAVEEKDCQEYSLPIYTDAIGKIGQNNGRNLNSGEWSQEGMLRFQKLQMKIEDLYDNDMEMMERLGQSVLEKYRELFGKVGTGSVLDDNIESECDQNKREKEDKEWDEFLRRNAKRRRTVNKGVQAAL